MRRLQPALDTIALVLSISLLIVSPEASQAQLTIKPVVLDGEPAPGTASGVEFSGGNFSDLQINGDGTLLFVAGLHGPGVTNEDDEGIWIGRPGDIELAVRTGDAAPGYGDGVEFAFVAKPVLGADGGAGFYARVRGPGVSEDAFTPGNDDCFWVVEPPLPAVSAPTTSAISTNRIDASRLKSAARTGDQASNGTRILAAYYESNILLVVVVLALLIAFGVRGGDDLATLNAAAELGEPTLFHAAAAATPVVLSAVGDTAPSLGENLLSIVDGSVLATADRVAFAGVLASGNAVFLGPPSDIAAVVLPNAEVPATLAIELGDGATYGANAGHGLAVNAAGEVALVTAVAVPPQFTQLTALVAGPADAPQLVALTRPDPSSDGFTQLSDVVLNAGGDVAFVAAHSSLGGDAIASRGLWVARDGGEPVLALAEGQTAAGLEASEVVSFFEQGPFMNARGEVVMRAGFGTGAGFENTTGNAIWLVDPVAGARLVARTGGTIDVGGGNLRTLDNASLITSHDRLLSGGEDGRPTVLNDLGQVVFQAHWQEPGGGAFRSGVFLAAGACEADTCRDTDVVCKRCGQPVGQGDAPTASDALAILRVAVGSASCESCVCDVDASGAVAATDALITLKRAVGQAVSLDCPTA